MNTVLKNKNHILLLSFVGFIIYSPALFNGFAYDDIPYILQNPAVHKFNFFELIGPNIFNSGSFYRPIPAIYTSSLYLIFGQQAFFYHFIQLSFHIINANLLFIFLLGFFNKNLATTLALIFLIHPINVESVANIASTNSEIFFLFGISALLLGAKTFQSKKRVVAISILLLLSALTKETGFIFLPLLLLFRYLYKLDKLRTFVISGIAIVSIYLVLRFFVGGVTLSSSNELIPIQQLSFIERIVNIPAIILHYIQTFLFPSNLSIWQLWVKTSSIQDFFMPLIICIAITIFLSWYIWYLYKQEKKHKITPTESKLRNFIFFLSWYLLGMAPLLQIIPLDMTVADRWFYLPSVGLLGVIAIGLQSLTNLSPKYKRMFFIIIIIILCILAYRTFVRVQDWKDNLTLYQHDVRFNDDNPILLVHLSGALYDVKKINEAILYAKKAVDVTPNLTTLKNLGLMYKGARQYDKAIEAYVKAIESTESSPGSNTNAPRGLVRIADQHLAEAYLNLADIYLTLNKPYYAIRTIKYGLTKIPTSSSSQLYFYMAIAEYQTGNTEKALDAIKKSYDLSPNKLNSYIYNRLKQGLPLK